jgi:hypothetical protein
MGTQMNTVAPTHSHTHSATLIGLVISSRKNPIIHILLPFALPCAGLLETGGRVLA